MNLMAFLPDGGRFKHVAGTSGGEWAGPCPACGGTDRFKVWPDHPGGAVGGRFMCRGCGGKGDGIQYLRNFAGMSYRDACKTFQTEPKALAGGMPRQAYQKAAWTPKASILPGQSWQKTADGFVQACSAALAATPAGRNYAASRGLTLETCARLGIGWNPVDRYDAREAWGLPEEMNPETGRPRKVWLPAGLVLPTFNGVAVTAIKIRRTAWTPQDVLPKYAAVGGGSQAPAILGVGPGKPVVVVESELDAILVHQEAGDVAGAIALRSATNKPDTATTAALKAASIILVALDFDDAGKRAWPWWKATFPAAVPWPVPFGKDVGDLMTEPGMVRAWIDAGLPVAALAEPEPGRMQEPVKEDAPEPSPLPGMFTQWQTPAGQRFILAAPPFAPETLTAWEARNTHHRGLEPCWPVMPPGAAWEALRAIEDAHAIQGFYVKPQWRGLSIPQCWPPAVGLSLQSLYLAASYGLEVQI